MNIAAQVGFDLFRREADRIIGSKLGLSIDDLPDAIDPYDYFDESMTTNQEVNDAAKEYAESIIDEVSDGLLLD